MEGSQNQISAKISISQVQNPSGQYSSKESSSARSSDSFFQMYLFIWRIELQRGREQNERQSSYPLGALFRSPMWIQGLEQVIFCCFSRHTSRDFGWKWSRWNSYWNSEGMLVFQTVVQADMFQHQPQHSVFGHLKHFRRLTPICRTFKL